jgi:hypothetical protein
MIILLAIIAILIAIAILSIPTYVASLVVVNKETANFGNAIGATIVTLIILIFLSVGLHFLFAPLSVMGNFVAFLITLFIILYVYSAIYDISMGRSFVLAIMEIIMWFIFFLVTGALTVLFAFI